MPEPRRRPKRVADDVPGRAKPLHDLKMNIVAVADGCSATTLAKQLLQGNNAATLSVAGVYRTDQLKANAHHGRRQWQLW